MRYEVIGQCCGCGFCAYCCPQLFSMNENGRAQADNKDPSRLESDAAAFALANCPSNAIVRTE